MKSQKAIVQMTMIIPTLHMSYSLKLPIVFSQNENLETGR